jgi:hypothetical protein
LHQENAKCCDSRTDEESAPREATMQEHNHDAVDTNRDEKDPYDELEERMKRIGIAIISICKGLKTSERIGHSIALITLLALIFYAGYTVKIYKATKKSADAAESAAGTARESLISGQRAFVIFQGSKFDIGHVTDTTGKSQEYIAFTAAWENVGTTAALVSAYMYNIADLHQVTEEQFTNGVVSGEEPQHLKRVIGPHDTYKVGPFLVPRREIKGWRQAQVTPEGRTYIFFGWIIYRDVFRDTPVHVSEFCRFPGLVGVDENRKINITFEYCREHNCADEQCKDYKEITLLPDKP